MPCLPAWIFLSSALDNGLISVAEFCGGMAEAAGSEEPVVEQPAAVNQDQQTGQAVEEGKVLGLVSLWYRSSIVQGEVAASSGWGSWGMGGLTNLLSQPHLLEQGLNNVASQVAQVRL